MVADVFVSMSLFAFGLFTLLAGVFTAYFGAGQSRGIGAVLLLVGVVAVGLFGWFTSLVPLGAVPPVAWSSTMAVDGIVSLVGAAVGAGVAVLLFLGAIMKA